jgi:hypothetical protein
VERLNDVDHKEDKVAEKTQMPMKKMENPDFDPLGVGKLYLNTVRMVIRRRGCPIDPAYE